LPPASADTITASASEAINRVKLSAADLPAGYGIGGMEGRQANYSAVAGYDDPQGVLERMNSTGRVDGYIQQITAAEAANGVGVSIEVWSAASGAKTYFDQFPRPESDVKYEEITVPNAPGEQLFAYKYQVNGQTGYSISWRRGRLILGVGALTAGGTAALDKLMTLANVLDKKAQGV